MMIISYYIIIVAYLKGKRRQKREGRSYLSEKAAWDFQFLMTLFYRLPPICCKIESSKAASSRFRSDCL